MNRKRLNILIIGIILAIILWFAWEYFIRKEAFLNSRGRDMYRKGKVEAAQNYFRKNSLRNPKDDLAAENLGKAQYRSKDFDEAEKSFKNSLAHSDDPAAIHYQLGNTHYQRQQYKEALEQYRQGLLLKPTDEDLRANYELALKALEKQEQPQSQPKDEPKEEPEEKKDKEELKNRLRALDQKESSDRRRRQTAPADPGGKWW